MAPEKAVEKVPRRDHKKRAEEGVLDTLQTLKGEKVRRRERITNSAWYQFLIVMLYVGGLATLGWIFSWGYQAGQSAAPRTTTIPTAVLPPIPQNAGMTTATVKEALAETETILSAVNRIAQQVQPPQKQEIVIRETVPLAPTAETPAEPPSIWDLNK